MKNGVSRTSNIPLALGVRNSTDATFKGHHRTGSGVLIVSGSAVTSATTNTPETIKPLTLDSANQSDPNKKFWSFDISSGKYLGAFRLEAEPGGEGLGMMRYGDGAIAYNPDNDSVFVSGHNTDNCPIAEFAIPATLSTSLTLSNLPIASALQGMVQVQTRGTGLKSGQVYQVKISGLYYNNGRLLVSVYGQYAQDLSFDSQFLVFRDSDNLATSLVDGWMLSPYPMAAAGSLTPIPASLQTALGGTHITGLSNSTNRASTVSLSSGPSAFAVNPDDILANSATIGNGSVSIQELQYYPLFGVLAPDENHLYNDDNGGAAGGNVLDPPSMWTHLCEIGATVILPGTSSYLCIGGYGGYLSGMWYGSAPGLEQGHHPNDLNDFRPFYWITSTDDLAEVKAGTKTLDQVIPNEYGQLTMPFFGNEFNKIGGIAVDEAGDRMFITLRDVDDSQGDGMPPIVLVYRLS